MTKSLLIIDISVNAMLAKNQSKQDYTIDYSTGQYSLHSNQSFN